MPVPINGKWSNQQMEPKELKFEIGALCKVRSAVIGKVIGRIWAIFEENDKTLVSILPMRFKLTEEQKNKHDPDGKLTYYFVKNMIVEKSRVTLLPLESFETMQLKKTIKNVKKEEKKEQLTLPIKEQNSNKQDLTTSKSGGEENQTDKIIPFQKKLPYDEPVRWITGIPVFNSSGPDRAYSHIHSGYIPIDIEAYKKSLT